MLNILPVNKYYDLFNPFTLVERKFANDFRTNVKETDEQYILEIEMPGFDKNEIDISIKNNVMTIKAEHSENKEKNENEKYIYSERLQKSYVKSFDVSEIDCANIKSSYNNGLLTINMPKNKEMIEEYKVNIE